MSAWNVESSFLPELWQTKAVVGNINLLRNVRFINIKLNADSSWTIPAIQDTAVISRRSESKSIGKGYSLILSLTITMRLVVWTRLVVWLYWLPICCARVDCPLWLSVLPCRRFPLTLLTNLNILMQVIVKSMFIWSSSVCSDIWRMLRASCC